MVMAFRLLGAVLGLVFSVAWATGQGASEGNGSAGTGTDAQGDPLPQGARARLGSTRYRPGGNITAAALSADGKWIATCNGGDVLTLSDPETGKEISRLRLPA